MNKLTQKNKSVFKRVLKYLLLKPITILCIKYKLDCTYKQAKNFYYLHQQFYK